MRRNVQLFVCFCLGASLLVLYFHLPLAHRATPSPTAPVNNSPATVADLPLPEKPSEIPVTDAALVSAAQNPGTSAAAETTSNSPSAENKTPVATIDPATATGEDKFKVLRDLTAWAAKDPEAALAAIMKLPEGEQRNEALAAVCSGLAQTDPADAVKVAQELHLDKQPAVMEDLVQQWATADLTSSLAWAEDQPAGPSRDEFNTRIAFIMSQAAPSDAATLVLNQIPPGPAQDEAIMTVLHQWANQDFAAAARWAQGVPGPLQQRVLNELNGILDYRRALAKN